MEATTATVSRKRVGRWIRVAALSSAVLTLLAAILVTDFHPRTDDASVRANFIEITAEVSGKLTSLPVKDNAFVKKGDLLFEIDPRPYQYALQQALSDQEALASSAPTELAPARDRLVGIGLALIIMWFVFDRVWPVRTVTMMRQALASVLRGEAQLLSVSGTEVQSPDLGSRIDGLRHQVSARIAEIRSLHEAVLYEFGVDHENHKAAGETILSAALSSGALFWNELAVLERNQDRDLRTDPRLLTIRSTLAGGLDALAESVAKNRQIDPQAGQPFTVPERLPDAREAEYASTMMSRYRDIESILATLSTTV